MFKKILPLLYLFLLLSLYGQEPFPLFYREKGEITIDGDNSDWPPFLIPALMESDSQLYSGLRLSPEEFKGALYSFFDAQNVYLYAEVTDKNPLNNRYNRRELYKGDGLYFYLGFRDEHQEGPLGPNDFEVGMGFFPGGVIKTIFCQKYELTDATIVAIPGGEGYRVEARIPLTQFGSPPLKEGRTLWFDCGISNGELLRARTGFVWWGDHRNWTNTVNWRESRLLGEEKFKELFFIHHPRLFLTDSYNRITIFYRGTPWRGQLSFRGKTYQTDSQGGVTLKSGTPGTFILSLKEGEQEFWKELTFLKKHWTHNSFVVIILYPILSALIPLLIFLTGVVIYLKRNSFRV